MTHLIVGLVLLVLGGWGIVAWWGDFGEFMRGLVPLVLALLGLMGIGAGWSRTSGGSEQEEGEEEAQTPSSRMKLAAGRRN